MWFKNLRIYRLNKPFELSAAELNERLDANEFQPCGKLDPQRSGWVMPLGRHGHEFIHVVNGYIVVAFKSEEKILPSAVVKEFLDDKIAQISDDEARHVSRKERDSLKDEIIFSLLPKAFTKSNVCFAYIALKENMIVVNASSAKRAEDLLNALRESIGTLACVPLVPKQAPALIMTQWVRDRESALNFDVGEECELMSAKDGRIIRCKNQDLTADEVINHIHAGMVVSKLALIWKEGVQFILDDEFSVKRLKFEDVIRDKAEVSNAETAAEEFDQEFAVMSVELAALIDDLIGAFGGIDRLMDDD